jgi:hypothetical protein
VILHFFPVQYFFRLSIGRGEFPFWNPYTFSGVPAFPNLQQGFSYPVHWALLWMPPIQGVNWLIGLHVILAGIGAAWCAGRLGAGKEGQFLCGAAYALGSAMTSRLFAGHLAFIETNAWLPIATGLAVRALERRVVIYLTLAIAIVILAGQSEIFLFCAWWLPIFAAFGVRQRHPAHVFSALLVVGVALGLGLGLTAFQVLPFGELVSVSFRQKGLSWDFATGWSLPPWQVLEILNPLLFGDPLSGYWPDEAHHWHEQLIYIGVVPLLAATMVRGRWRWVLLGLAAVAVVLAFGRYGRWYAWVVAVLPGYGSFRVPSKHLTLAALALALAAGLGVQRLTGRHVAALAIAGAVCLLAAGLTAEFWLPWWVLALGENDKLAQPGVRQSAEELARSGLMTSSAVLALVAAGALLRPPWSIRAQLMIATLELAIMLQPFRTNLSDPNSILSQAQPLLGQTRAAWVGGGGAAFANYGPLLRVTLPDG